MLINIDFIEHILPNAVNSESELLTKYFYRIDFLLQNMVLSE